MAAAGIPGIVLDGQVLLDTVNAVLWASLRIGGMMLVVPLLSTRVVPRRVKGMFVLTLAFAMAPLAGPPPPLPGIDPLSIGLALRELLLGVLMGFLLRLAFEAGAMAGEMVSQGTGLGFAVLADPLRGTNAGVVGQWFYLAFSLIFLSMDGHLGLIAMVADSWKAVPLRDPMPLEPAHFQVVTDFVAIMLRTGLQVALPVVLAMLAVNIAFGVLSRAAPALNPIQLGLPASVLLGLWLLGFLFGELEQPLRDLFEAAFREAGRLTGGS